MRSKLTLIFFMALLAPVIGVSGDLAKPAATASDDLMAKVERIQVGSSTRSEIAQLLGTPWRTVDTNDDPDDDDYRVWEYVGQDATGRFRIHIGFDEANIVRLIAKVPQNGPVHVLARSDSAGDEHKHDSTVHDHEK
jgi:SmpA / OmlA family